MNSATFSIVLLLETVVIMIFGVRIFIKLRNNPDAFLSRMYLGYKGKLPLTFIFLLLGSISILVGFVIALVEFLMNSRSLFWEYPTLVIYFFLALFFITFVPSVKLKEK
jgi:hypothetical protein